MIKTEEGTSVEDSSLYGQEAEVKPTSVSRELTTLLTGTRAPQWQSIWEWSILPQMVTEATTLDGFSYRMSSAQPAHCLSTCIFWLQPKTSHMYIDTPFDL